MVTAGEAQANYSSCTGAPSNTTGLMLWGKMDEGSGLVVTDYSTFAKNAETKVMGWGGGLAMLYQQHVLLKKKTYFAIRER